MWLDTEDSLINFDFVSSIRITKDPPADPVLAMEVSVKTPKVLFKGSFDDCQEFKQVLKSWLPGEQYDSQVITENITRLDQ